MMSQATCRLVNTAAGRADQPSCRLMNTAVCEVAFEQDGAWPA
jgi:hypothetical protein